MLGKRYSKKQYDTFGKSLKVKAAIDDEVGEVNAAAAGEADEEAESPLPKRPKAV